MNLKQSVLVKDIIVVLMTGGDGHFNLLLSLVTKCGLYKGKQHPNFKFVQI